MIPLQTGDIVPAELVGVRFMLVEQHINSETYADSFWSVGQIQDPSQRLERNGREVWLHDDCLMLVWASPRQ